MSVISTASTTWALLLRLAFVGLMVIVGGYVLNRAQRIVPGV